MRSKSESLVQVYIKELWSQAELGLMEICAEEGAFAFCDMSGIHSSQGQS